jgi:hypothetical protein
LESHESFGTSFLDMVACGLIGVIGVLVIIAALMERVPEEVKQQETELSSEEATEFEHSSVTLIIQLDDNLDNRYLKLIKPENISQLEIHNMATDYVAIINEIPKNIDELIFDFNGKPQGAKKACARIKIVTELRVDNESFWLDNHDSPIKLKRTKSKGFQLVTQNTSPC